MSIMLASPDITLGARIHPELHIKLRGGTGAVVSSPVPPAPASVTPARTWRWPAEIPNRGSGTRDSSCRIHPLQELNGLSLLLALFFLIQQQQ